MDIVSVQEYFLPTVKLKLVDKVLMKAIVKNVKVDGIKAKV